MNSTLQHAVDVGLASIRSADDVSAELRARLIAAGYTAAAADALIASTTSLARVSEDDARAYVASQETQIRASGIDDERVFVLLEALVFCIADPQTVQTPPSGALGYGLDLSCASDLTANMTETDPTSAVGIAESTLRRWDTPRGSLPPDGRDAKEAGYDLRGALSRGTTDRDLRQMQRELEGEALKDDRIASITAPVTFTGSAASASVSVSATITPTDPRSKPFQLILVATSAEVVIQSIGAAS